MWADKSTTKTKTCINCGDPFTFKPSQLTAYPNAGKYCSRKCGYSYRVKENAKKPILTNRVVYRHAEKQWQKAVREKDACICQRCGVYEKYIHTHHVATRKRRPDLKYRVSNGVCLCGACHGWVHTHPIEAQALGLLSNASYELERLKGRKERTATAASLRKNGKVIACGICGTEKYVGAATIATMSKRYRCMNCRKARLPYDD
jgi:hypothetical protein